MTGPGWRRSRLAPLLVATLALASFGALARSLSTLPQRRTAALHPGTEPFLWRRISPPVRALERLLAAHQDRLPRGEAVLVVARDRGGADSGFVWHWAQYLAPAANFVAAQDVGGDAETGLVLTWGDVSAAPRWRRLGQEDGFVLYEVQR